MTRKAILIGVDTYTNGFAHLPEVASDLKVVRRLFSEHCGYEIDEPLQRDHQSLEAYLRQALLALKEDDEVLFYYSGHGKLGGAAQEFFLAGDNTSPDDPETTGIAFSNVRFWVGACKARSAVLIVDACYAGGIVPALLTMDCPINSCWIAACDKWSEIDLPPTHKPHSLSPLTSWLNDSILAGGDDGDMEPVVTTNDIVAYLTDNMPLPRPQVVITGNGGDIEVVNSRRFPQDLPYEVAPAQILGQSAHTAHQLLAKLAERSRRSNTYDRAILDLCQEVASSSSVVEEARRLRDRIERKTRHRLALRRSFQQASVEVAAARHTLSPHSAALSRTLLGHLSNSYALWLFSDVPTKQCVEVFREVPRSWLRVLALLDSCAWSSFPKFAVSQVHKVLLYIVSEMRDPVGMVQAARVLVMDGKRITIPFRSPAMSAAILTFAALVTIVIVAAVGLVAPLINTEWDTSTHPLRKFLHPTAVEFYISALTLLVCSFLAGWARSFRGFVHALIWGVMAVGIALPANVAILTHEPRGDWRADWSVVSGMFLGLLFVPFPIYLARTSRLVPMSYWKPCLYIVGLTMLALLFLIGSSMVAAHVGRSDFSRTLLRVSILAVHFGAAILIARWLGPRFLKQLGETGK